MERVTAASAPTTVQRSVRLVGYPDSCPRCQSNVVPRHIGTFARSHVLTTDVEEVFQCTAGSCGGVFIAVYRASEIGRRQPKYTYQRSFPTESPRPAVSGMATLVSPRFYQAYAQALAADASGWTELAGIGLRRALELLIKEFAKQECPHEATAIEITPLADCIGEFIRDVNVRAVAQRASWLCDDTAPYFRNWSAKEIGELKLLVHLTINAVDSALETRKHIAEERSPT